MNCKEVMELLGELIDGECENDKEILSHLESCEDCKREYDELVKLKKRFKDVVEESNTSLADSVVSEIRKELYPQRKTPFLLRRIGLVASLVIIACLAIYSSLPKPESDKAEEVKNTASENSKYAIIKDAVAELEEEAEPESAPSPVPSFENHTDKAECESVYQCYSDDSALKGQVSTVCIPSFEIIVAADISLLNSVLEDKIEIISCEEDKITIPSEDTELALGILSMNSIQPSTINLSYGKEQLPTVIKEGNAQ